MKSTYRFGLRSVLSASILLSVYSTATSAQSTATQVNKDVLAKVSELYGIDEQSALRRLAAESEASDIDQALRGAHLSGYAGSWFDPATLKLQVATNAKSDFPEIEFHGAVPLLVEHSMKSLEARMEKITRANSRVFTGDEFRSSYVDPRSNRIVVEVAPGAAGSVRQRLAEDARWTTVIETTDGYYPTADVYGADGTRNATWASTYGGTWPCSIGVTTTDGYYTAGHCGGVGNTINTPGGTLLGTVVHSTYPISSEPDIAWVQLAAGWMPRPYINGYSDGTITVPAKWSGVREAAIGATTCRYGQTSGGPHCGTINSKNVNVGSVTGLTRVATACASDGDSGGPFTAGSDDQVQGTLTGKSSAVSCPTNATYLYFQPIAAHIAAYDKNVLTAHGANAPTVNSLQCSSPSYLGPYTYRCQISSYNSQGPTTVSWSTSAGHSSSDTHVKGSCTPSTDVNVTLTVDNDYGSPLVVFDSVTCLQF